MKFFNRFNTTISIVAGLVAILAFLGIKEYTDLIPDKEDAILKVRKMSFRVTECSDPKYPEGKLTGFYDIQFKKDGNQIRGHGFKHSEVFHEKFMRYSKNFEVDIVGQVQDGELVAQVYEDNGRKTHKIEGTIRLNLETLKGTMNTDFFNCTGVIELQ